LAANENLGWSPSVLSKSEFEKVVRRFDGSAVRKTLEFARRRKTQSFSLSVDDQCFLGKAGSKIFDLLFENQDLERLWVLYTEVSKEATPSHQTPEARVTSERKDESHHTPI
jgi:hypothetical protein